MPSAVDALLALPARRRRTIMASLSSAERQALFKEIQFREDNPWLKYQGDPVGFVEDGLGETLWSKQKEVLRSLVENKRTAVPASHAPGKTHLAARAVAYWATAYPPGTAKIITTATSNRQVKGIMWPHIRRLQSIHELPGYTNTIAWMMGDPVEAVAEGVKPPDDDEAAMQGYHKANMLIVVDEAGGIKSSFGRSLEGLMTGENTRMLILGNPPTEDEGTWFERICSNNPLYNVIPISAYDTPNFTGEKTGLCHSCPPGVLPHTVSTHLVDDDWVESVIQEFGKDSAYYQARVLAQFPRNNTSKTLPISWLESAHANTEADTGGRVKLGVDVASDGGDEFVIAKLDGWRATIEHHKTGADNEDAVRVAGKIVEEIHKAEILHFERGIQDRVRVKIDSIGVGWGVTSLLKEWQREGRFKAEIVGVNVSEKARDSQKFANQRAELWWNTRQLIQPGVDDNQILWLDVTTKELAQMNGPTYRTDSSGRIYIEKKIDMKRRGLTSPDRAEALLLAVYEPPNNHKAVQPIVMSQTNVWGSLSI